MCHKTNYAWKEIPQPISLFKMIHWMVSIIHRVFAMFESELQIIYNTWMKRDVCNGIPQWDLIQPNHNKLLKDMCLYIM